ncbi:hypothetical protein [Vulcanisaeta sp. JCM 16161]|uniref:hypothetical protein n=1 Tax=Vulcanisaeta sp. JCM 16161 TaxID=1295372 RepID=UPI001FB42649|nr:hypothetical protein [Vulcanisaeta sp. JCM 16161]
MAIYKRAVSTILLLILITIIIIKGRNFRIGEIHRKSAKFIETAVRDRKLLH